MRWEQHADKIVLIILVILTAYSYMNQDTWQIQDYKVKYGTIILSIIGLLITHFRLQPKPTQPQQTRTQQYPAPDYYQQEQRWQTPPQQNYPKQIYQNTQQPTYPTTPTQYQEPPQQSPQETHPWKQKIKDLKQQDEPQ